MIKLAETYFRLDLHLARSDQEKLQNALTEVARRRAVGLFGQPPEIAVFVEDGSLKAWVVFAGSLYIAIGNYGSFREGLDRLIKDAKIVGTAIIAAVEDSGISEMKILRTERRTAVPGKLKRIIGQLDRLELDQKNLSDVEYKQRLSEIRRKLIDVLAQIENAEDRSLTIKNLPAPVREGLPLNLPKLPRLGMPIALKPEEFDVLQQPRHLIALNSGGLVPPIPKLPSTKPKTYHVITKPDGFTLVPD